MLTEVLYICSRNLNIIAWGSDNSILCQKGQISRKRAVLRLESRVKFINEAIFMIYAMDNVALTLRFVCIYQVYCDLIVRIPKTG